MRKLNINIHSQEAVGRWIKELIAADNLHVFYTSSYWLKLRKEVLAEQNNECQICKSRGQYSKATTVHHNQYVRKHPRLALSKTYEFRGKVYKNLVALCHSCHEEVHGYRQPAKPKEEPLTVERW